MTEDKPKRIHWRSEELYQALIDAGIVRKNDYVRRVVIDIQVGHAVQVHVERFADERVFSLIRGLNGIEVHCSEDDKKTYGLGGVEVCGVPHD